jgi:hypothetical protein
MPYSLDTNSDTTISSSLHRTNTQVEHAQTKETYVLLYDHIMKHFGNMHTQHITETCLWAPRPGSLRRNMPNFTRQHRSLTINLAYIFLNLLYLIHSFKYFKNILAVFNIFNIYVIYSTLISLKITWHMVCVSLYVLSFIFLCIFYFNCNAYQLEANFLLVYNMTRCTCMDPYR